MLSTDGPNHSTCSASCLQLWPAVAPGAHAGVTAKVGSTATPSGTMTATVAGHPVYTFSGDQGPGDVNGEGLQDFGGVWYAVSPSGAAVTAAAARELVARARRRRTPGAATEIRGGPPVDGRLGGPCPSRSAPCPW